MKCTYCGAEVSAGKSFCMWCGARLTEEMPVQTLKTEEIPAQTLKTEEIPAAAPIEEEFPEIRAVMEAPLTAPEPVQRPRRIPPRLQLPAQRGLGKMFFLGILTFGIYPIVIWSRIVTELNIVASRYDGKRTMSYFGMVMLSPITLGIYPLVWMHNFCHRIQDESVRRNTGADFGPSDFWLWGMLGSLIIVGPFIFIHKLMKAMNMLNTNYNVYG